MKRRITYKAAGVDIDKGNEFVSRIKNAFYDCNRTVESFVTDMKQQGVIGEYETDVNKEDIVNLTNIGLEKLIKDPYSKTTGLSAFNLFKSVEIIRNVFEGYKRDHIGKFKKVNYN